VPTETVDPRHADLATRPLAEVVSAIWDGQRAAVASLENQLSPLAGAAEAMASRLRQGNGRIAYAGAGTSGRIAVQDGVELVPTFGWDPSRVLYLLAGGPAALRGAVEGAEDDGDAGRAAVVSHGLGSADVLIALAASGSTPFTCEALEAARANGALTIAISNNPGSRLLRSADHAILADTGAEVIAGSTRMAAGTAQRAALTILSSAAMVALGLVHQGRMVAMRPTNAKLRARAAAMVGELAAVTPEHAEAALNQSAGAIPLAVLIARGMELHAARELLALHNGSLAAALEERRS
jgi:N-acetylmuramic acid 6-phosphate etherase